MEMLDKLTYKFFAGLDNFALKLDSVCYAGYKIIRDLFNKKRKGRKRKNPPRSQNKYKNNLLGRRIERATMRMNIP